MNSEKYLFAEMTWPEIKQAVKEQRVAVIPVAVIEQHGHHLPVNTDLLLASEVCLRAGAKIPGRAVVVPPVNHGYSPHQMDFPGVITIGAETFIRYVTDVCNSLAHQGFTRILIVNGHGSNVPLLQVAAKQTMLEYPDVLCTSISYWDLQPVLEEAEQIRESVNPGGMNHACEFETSLYLALRGELVQMDKAVRDLDKYEMGKYFWLDIVGRGEGRPTVTIPYWSTISETGVLGDPTGATLDKGQVLLQAAVEGLVEYINIFRKRKLGLRVNHHR
ncbi:MAG TPA: creatininase family protein [Desulfotomaculum sp.]|nr:MAG: hypothetical protein JL56_17200 [Desulfotomaculum sp. BICA1-6]HBX22278.1 creatininase family protein [Desulfotomaculum sp.]